MNIDNAEIVTLLKLILRYRQFTTNSAMSITVKLKYVMLTVPAPYKSHYTQPQPCKSGPQY